MKKVAIVTCYFDPDYVRARTLRAGLANLNEVQTATIKNRHVGFLRYPEIILRLVALRITKRPDIYLLTFRGQEILPFLLLLAWPKKIVFDEFIVPLAWAKQEGHKINLRTSIFKFLAFVSAPFYKIWLKSCDAVLTDTKQHAEISAKLSNVPTSKYSVIPVSTDETLFKPAAGMKPQSSKFIVFFYGLKMTPLHGLKYILEAAEIIGQKIPAIQFVIVGGDAKTEQAIKRSKENGATITYHKRIPFEKLPAQIYAANLCLAGPFGGTPQANNVVTGKAYQFLACAAPTIIGRNQAATDLTDGQDCLMVNQAEAEALANKIEWAYKNLGKLQAIGQKGYATYKSKFSNKVVTEELSKVISRI